MTAPEHRPDEVLTVLAIGGGVATRLSLQRVGTTHADLDAWCKRRLLERVTRGVYAEPLADATREVRYRRLVHGVLLTKDGPRRGGDRSRSAGVAQAAAARHSAFRGSRSRFARARA